MNNTETEYRSNRVAPSQNDKLEAYFKANPGQWIDMPELAKAITPTGIGAAVHSRVSDLRKRGLMIDHRNQFHTEDGRGVCCSQYMFVGTGKGGWCAQVPEHLK